MLLQTRRLIAAAFDLGPAVALRVESPEVLQRHVARLAAVQIYAAVLIDAGRMAGACGGRYAVERIEIRILTVRLH